MFSSEIYYIDVNERKRVEIIDSAKLKMKECASLLLGHQTIYLILQLLVLLTLFALLLLLLARLEGAPRADQAPR